MTELYAPGIALNQAALEAGQAATHIFTKPFFDCFTSIGGSGSTTGLLIACLMRHRDNGARKIARISIAPALFNINEILLFGLPVVLNPVFLIPFILVPVILTVVAYLATIAGLVPVTIHEVAWNVPIFISGYQATGSMAGVALQLVCLGLSVAMFLPFVSLDNWLKAEQFDTTFKKLVQVTTSGEVGEQGPRFLSSPDTVGSLARFLAQDLERGLEKQEFYLQYQPQVDSRSGQVYGVEALLRWRHPQIGMVPPPVFIGLAEDSGFIGRLGLWIVERAARQAGEWRRMPGAEKVVVSINVSARQLDDPELPDKMLALLNQYEVPVSGVKVEVTESIAIGGHAGHKVLSRFSELGFKLAIDDFGMGHTSLSYLKEFQVSSLKLDSILSRDVLVSRSSREIITTIAELCRSLDIELIAEFVEDEPHLLKLRELGCFNIQGYYYSPPLNPDDCLKFLLSRHRAYGEFEAPARDKPSPAAEPSLP
jgi:EAL domain-containing protein (putative c-di-GMP-specific phosphodiesterase class I)